MIVVAPASFAPAIAAMPTPPQPMTATDSPRLTSPVLMAAPMPAITPQPSSPTAAGSASSSTLVHCPAATRVFSANAPMPSAGDSSVPSSRVIFWVALAVLKQYCGWPLAHARHSPADRTPVQDHPVTRGHLGDTRAHGARPRRWPHGPAGRGTHRRCRPACSADPCGRPRRSGCPPGPPLAPDPAPGSSPTDTGAFFSLTTTALTL